MIPLRTKFSPLRWRKRREYPPGNRVSLKCEATPAEERACLRNAHTALTALFRIRGSKVCRTLGRNDTYEEHFYSTIRDFQ